MLEKLTFEEMNALVGTTFGVEIDGHSIDLTLARAGKVMESEAARLPRHPFSLFFTGPAAPFLPQKTYRLHHEQLGTLEIFLVPVGKFADGFQYEAVFT